MVNPQFEITIAVYDYYGDLHNDCISKTRNMAKEKTQFVNEYLKENEQRMSETSINEFLIGVADSMVKYALEEMVSNGFLHCEAYYAIFKTKNQIVILLKPRYIFRIRSIKLVDVGSRVEMTSNLQDINIKKYDYKPITRGNVDEIVKFIITSLQRVGYQHPEIYSVSITKAGKKEVDLEIVYDRKGAFIFKDLQIFIKGSPASREINQEILQELHPELDSLFTVANMDKIHDTIKLIVGAEDVNYILSIEKAMQDDKYVVVKAYVSKYDPSKYGFSLNYLGIFNVDPGMHLGSIMYAYHKRRLRVQASLGFDFNAQRAYLQPSLYLWYNFYKPFCGYLLIDTQFSTNKYIIPDNLRVILGPLIAVKWKRLDLGISIKNITTIGLGYGRLIPDAKLRSHFIVPATLWGLIAFAPISKPNYYQVKLFYEYNFAIKDLLQLRSINQHGFYVLFSLDKMMIYSMMNLRALGVFAGVGHKFATTSQGEYYQNLGYSMCLGLIANYNGIHGQIAGHLVKDGYLISGLIQTRRWVFAGSFCIVHLPCSVKLGFISLECSTKSEYYTDVYSMNRWNISELEQFTTKVRYHKIS